ncbi:GNAT family N-acetyltransferase [Lutispora sp.]|uniref:GNAT family N-acetyltransferase n=1 Tax=Lutispora sp. TaxID=2828727 RepID=UPI003568095D
MENLIIRQVRDSDIGEIKNIVRAAFDRPGKDQYFNEWEFVDKVRNDSGFIPELCLVAISDNEIIGYILLSRALIGKNEGLALGPLAVRPDCQRKGIGKRLIEHGIEKAKEYNFDWIALTGGDYYKQFGFESALVYGIKLGYNHPENPYLKIKFLNTNKNVFGNMRFCDSFYDENGDLL